MDWTLFICLLSHVAIVVSQMQVWLSTGDSQKRLNPEPAIGASGQPGNGYRIDVDSSQRYQQIKGFGAALSNAAAYLLNNRPEAMRALFDPSDGIGISYIRLVMGGSDFNAAFPYTYNDILIGTDFLLEDFSIEDDRDYVLPVLKEALRINPELKIMATPWSAPAWMKSTQSLNDGQLYDDILHMDTYARYFVRFLQAYEAEGIRIDTLTVQNEPEHGNGGYPTMRMSWQQQRDFIRDYLGPELRDADLSYTPELIIWDHNWDMSWYPLNILGDSEAAQYVNGSAWHCYGGDFKEPGNVKNQYPDKDIYFTECSGGAWDEHFGSSIGWNVQRLFIGQCRQWARTVILWNLALDENHGPRVGVTAGCTDCRGVVTVRPGSFERNIEYYAIGHFSKFVKPGAVRVESTTYEPDGQNVESIAYENPDRSLVVVVLNSAWGDNDRDFSVQIGGQFYNYRNLPSRSVITLILPA